MLYSQFLLNLADGITTGLDKLGQADHSTAFLCLVLGDKGAIPYPENKLRAMMPFVDEYPKHAARLKQRIRWIETKNSHSFGYFLERQHPRPAEGPTESNRWRRQWLLVEAARVAKLEGLS